MATGTYFVTRAMKKLGALDPGRLPTSDELQQGLDTLNQIVDAWAAVPGFIPFVAIFRQLFPSSKQSYTVGPGGDINVSVRPVDLLEANIVFNQGANEVHLPITLLLRKERIGIPVPQISTSIPIKGYYDQGFVSTPGVFPALATAGLGTLFLNPFPAAPLPDIEFTYPSQIAQFDQTTDYLFKPAFTKAITLTLAEEMWEFAAPDMNRDQLRQLAAEARAIMAGASPNKPPRMTVDSGFGQTRGRADWNWTTGNLA